ncbi:MAG: ABC transporter ATP-binding protein/permease [Gammaproteobacteria bacterium]|jgi:ATP-binding cassette, subfamily B, heavy metal transporter|nr:ABC transporter ATP-binding protein/permease [Gammaproteobacteria bacterium]MBT5683596.1 ABC transporter ATP-binding protein/permease [Gammaproteobacteria bacterium]MBT5722660.1 ABC transporter ATP-binding protein/permease [Gammaproteobacteria bacterium]MBT6585405.1 ABC transporter ATP-binding protein/permease [Gammaproteobacteria bacterium]MBT7880165.1 ABC transporter ATP-binding protein/permease [Gammaproteobacteria bacterium]
MEHFSHATAFADPLSVDGAPQRTAWQTVKSILPFLWPKQRRDMQARVVIAVACLLLGRTANVYGPIVLKDLIDGLESLVRTTQSIDITLDPSSAIAGLVSLAMMYGLMVFLPGALTELRSAVFTPVSEFAQRVIGLKAFSHIHDLSMRFHLDRRTGGLSRAIERGTRALQQITGLFAFNIAPTLFEIGLVSVYLAVTYPIKYVLVILVAVVGYVAFTLIFTEWRTKFRREMVSQESRATSIGVDSLLNFETVKYFGNEKYEADRYNDALLKYMDAAVKSQDTLGMLNAGQLIARVLCQVTILMLAVQDHAAGQLSTGEVVMINTFMLQLFIPLGFLGSSYRMIRQSMVDMEYMFQLLDLNPEVRDDTNATPLEVNQGEIQFKDVCFTYERERKVLSDINFSIYEGRTVAVVGPSGSGKSTLSRLLYRFYDTQEGSILIDGQDITHVTQASLRNTIGIVPQDTVLFNDTIRYNIRYGNPQATDEEVANAAKLASIHDFITDLPHGYETRVGERGLKLSGGEKQRVAIARTVLKNPKILVLDEATSALDIKTEREIQAALEEVAKNRTTLVIAHRLSTIVNADEILVLSAGEIIERGSHLALVKADGTYAEMWRRQKEAADEIEKIQEIFTGDELRSLQIEADKLSE